MKELHIEGIANHDDPESCATAREGGGEVLAGARTGSVLSRENRQSGCSGPSTFANGKQRHLGTQYEVRSTRRERLWPWIGGFGNA